jgi:hypothetical protein
MPTAFKDRKGWSLPAQFKDPKRKTGARCTQHPFAIFIISALRGRAFAIRGLHASN